MAMNAAVLAASIVARLYPLYRSEAPANKVQDPDYFLLAYAEIIAEEVIGHIQAFARCNGIDSHNDTHDNVQIV